MTMRFSHHAHTYLERGGILDDLICRVLDGELRTICPEVVRHHVCAPHIDVPAMRWSGRIKRG